ncbi:MAG: hypothetical protein HQK49_21925 [Oligoflexia bacterium]|nr:hypothetical protein [Oligoflexia bacterium]
MSELDQGQGQNQDLETENIKKNDKPSRIKQIVVLTIIGIVVITMLLEMIFLPMID